MIKYLPEILTILLTFSISQLLAHSIGKTSAMTITYIIMVVVYILLKKQEKLEQKI